MGPTTELAGSRFISKRKTLRGVKERFSIVGNRAILTLTKEKEETDNHSGRPSGSLHNKSRKGEPTSNDKGGSSTPPGARVPPSERTASELQSPAVPELVSIKDHSNSRYLKSRESAMNHMIYYLNQGNDLNGAKEGLKRIDLTKVKPQLISSEEVLTKSPHHPSSPKRKIVEYNSHELSELEKRAGHPTRYVGSFSDQSDDENPYLAAAIPGKDIDILEVKNLDKAQILEILEMTREEKRSHQHRIEHLEKRTEALEKIIVAESDQEADATHLIASFRGKLRDLLQQGENFRDQLRKFGELDVIAASPTDQQVLNTIKFNTKHIIQALDDITRAVPENLKPIGKGKDVALFEICPLQLRIPCATIVHLYEVSPYVRFPPKTTLGRLQEKYSILTLGRSSTATGHFGGEPLKSPHIERAQLPSQNSINPLSPQPSSPKKGPSPGSGKKLALNLKRSNGPSPDTHLDEWVPRFARCSPRGEPEYVGPYTPKGLQPSSSGFMGPLETASQNDDIDKGRRDTLNSKTSGQGLSFGGSFRKPGGSEINQLEDPDLNGLWHGNPSFGHHPALGLETIQELANRSGRGSGCSQDASRQFQEMKAEIAVQKEASAIRAAELFNQNRIHLGQTQTKTRISLGPRLNPSSIKRSPNQFESRGSHREESAEFKRTIAARIFAVGRKNPPKVDTSFEDRPSESVHNSQGRPQKASWRDPQDKKPLKKLNATLTPIAIQQNNLSDEQRNPQKMQQAEPYSILDNFRLKQAHDFMSSDACQPGNDRLNALALGSTTSSEAATQAKNSVAHTSLDQQDQVPLWFPRSKSFQPPPAVHAASQSVHFDESQEHRPHFHSQTSPNSSGQHAEQVHNPTHQKSKKHKGNRSTSHKRPTNEEELLQMVLSRPHKAKRTLLPPKKLRYEAEEERSPYII